MHLGIPALLDFYHLHASEESLVLVTIIATQGSTYRKPGAMMLISRDESFEGMISGGCLEGDLLHHAAEVFNSGQAKFVTYDMHAGDDLVWNLGLGCDGVIHLLLQRLDGECGFEFLEQLDASHAARRAALIALKTGSNGSTPVGSTALLDRAGRACGDPALLEILQDASKEVWPEWRCRKIGVSDSNEVGDMILVNIPPQTRVVVCGAGPDAVPVVRALSALDWDVHIVDHRPSYARGDRFPDKCRVIQARPEQLSEVVNLDEVDAAVVMSHHLDNDSIYLSQLAKKDIAYLGCLGPRARRDRLRDMAGCPDRQVFGPVGLDIGAELPEAIALSLAAEIHAVLNRRSGLPLTPPDANDPE